MDQSCQSGYVSGVEDNNYVLNVGTVLLDEVTKHIVTDLAGESNGKSELCNICNGVCRASALLRYVQSAAQAQLNENGMSYNQLKSANRAFIISRLRMEFDAPVYPYEALEAITFPCESRGYSFLRCYQLNRGGVPVGRAVSIWALIDTEKRSLVRVNDFALNLPLLPPLDLSVSHIRMPAEITEVGTYTVSYADTDQNRHMNNTRYADMYASFLPMDGMRIHSLSISYLAEAPMGETLRVYRAYENGVYYLRTVREDGKTNTEAEIVLAEI